MVAITGSPSIDAVEDHLYIGNLSAATSLDLRETLGITHILSVCPEYPSTGPNHLTIAVDDSEYEDLLIRLPEACQFIQDALRQGGTVLCHCVMGISRSATVVSAYLMMTQHLSASAAMREVKKHRKFIQPNYGFVKQLDAFSACNYRPSPSNAVYREWKRKQQADITSFLNKMVDTTPIVPDKLFLSSDFPADREQALSLLLDLDITHVLSLSPAQISSATIPAVMHRHFNISNNERDSLLVAMPDICRFIRDAIDAGKRVLVHCLVESRACTAVCSYLMCSQQKSPGEAFAILEEALPLFNPTRNFLRHLELFEACEYEPTSDNPLVKAWAAEPGVAQASSVADGNPDNAEAIRAAATNVLSETGFDLGAFSEVLSHIQASNAQS